VPGAGGRPRRHGAKFAFADPATWPAPTTTLVTTDDQYGTVTVQAWAGCTPMQHRHPGHGSGGPRPIVRGTIIRVQVERVPARTRPPKVLWLWWASPASSTWSWCGAPTPAASTWSTRQVLQADPGLGHAAAAHARAGRAVDLAGAGLLHPAAPGPPARGRSAAAVGATPPARAAVALPGPPGVLRLLCTLGSPAAAPKPSGHSPGRPKATAPAPPCVTRRSTSPPPSPPRRPARSRPGLPRLPDQRSTPATQPTRSAAHPPRQG
jgi:hypothetical protein